LNEWLSLSWPQAEIQAENSLRINRINPGAVVLMTDPGYPAYRGRKELQK
jgi:hypothetical protein